MTGLVLALLLLFSQPGAARSAVEALRHLLRRGSTFVLSVRRNQVAIDDAIWSLKCAAFTGLAIVSYSAICVWPYGTVAGRLVFALTLMTATYIVMGTCGTVELMRERKQWITAQRMIDL